MNASFNENDWSGFLIPCVIFYGISYLVFSILRSLPSMKFDNILWIESCEAYRRYGCDLFTIIKYYAAQLKSVILLSYMNSFLTHNMHKFFVNRGKKLLIRIHFLLLVSYTTSAYWPLLSLSFIELKGWFYFHFAVNCNIQYEFFF